MNELEALRRRIGRERDARREAEHLLEERTRALFASTRKLTGLTSQLRKNIGFKTRQLLNAQKLAGLGTFVWDIRREEITWSDGVYSILGIDPSEQSLSYERYMELVHHEDREKLKSAIFGAIEQGLPSNREYITIHRASRPDGEICWIKGLAEVSVSEEGTPEYLFATVQDITDLKRADDKLQHSQQLLEERLEDLERTRRSLEIAHDEAQSANLTKSRFIAMISHEIRTPINGVLGSLSLLADTSVDAAQRELLDVATSSAQSLRVMLNDVIDFSRLETGQIQLEPADFSVHSLIRQACGFWQPLAAASGNQMNVSIDDRVPRNLYGDPIRIGQVLNNLLSNATKFTDNGSITVRVESEQVNPPATFPVNLTIEVTDSGVGISKEDQTELFKEFSQLRPKAPASANARSYDAVGSQGGAGLGLAICQALVEQMGGKISVISAAGKGSTFCVRLPLGEASGESLAADTIRLAPLKTMQGAKPRVLIAEDIPANQLVTRLMLDRFGCCSDIVENGAEAVTASTNERYDLILMDVSMPVLDGIEATRQIRSLADAKVASVPIIGLTAFAFDDEMDRLYEAGMSRVVNKPVHRELLYGAVKWALHSSEDEETESTSSAADPAINVDVLENMMAKFSEEQKSRVIGQVSDDLKKHRRNAIRTAKSGDAIELGRSCHAIKGLASSFGGKTLAELASQIELFVRSGDNERAFATTFDRLDSTTDAALAVFDRLTKSRPTKTDNG